jgi:AraC-like DNA-binding protein
MSQDRHHGSDPHGPALDVVTFPMPAGLTFDWHTHPDHQLAWALTGVLTVRTDTDAWVLPCTRALWIPAGLRHETMSAGNATMRTLYLRPGRCPIDWPTCQPVAAPPLLAELIGYLGDPSLEAGKRAHAEAVLVDLLEPVAMTSIQVRKPTDVRAARIANALTQDPADGRTLEEWGREVGASARTLARVFLAETGLPFARWRTSLRIRTAMIALAGGQPVGVAARRVGYESLSAFIVAFSRETGMTPSNYFRNPVRSVPAPDPVADPCR